MSSYNMICAFPLPRLPARGRSRHRPLPGWPQVPSDCSHFSCSCLSVVPCPQSTQWSTKHKTSHGKSNHSASSFLAQLKPHLSPPSQPGVLLWSHGRHFPLLFLDVTCPQLFLGNIWKVRIVVSQRFLSLQKRQNLSTYLQFSKLTKILEITCEIKNYILLFSLMQVF